MGQARERPGELPGEQSGPKLENRLFPEIARKEGLGTKRNGSKKPDSGYRTFSDHNDRLAVLRR